MEREFCVVWFLLSDALVKWKVVQSTFLCARSHVSDSSSVVKGSSLEEVELEFLNSCKPFFCWEVPLSSAADRKQHIITVSACLSTSLLSEGNLSQLLLKQAANQLVASGT